MKQMKRVHYYTAPSIRMFESSEELNISKLGEVADQQEKDLVTATILCGLWMAGISRMKHTVDYTDGRVLQILEHYISRYITSCLRHKRECSYDSLFNWCYEIRRSNKGVQWKGNMNRACKVLWKTLPKALKRGNKRELGSIVWTA